MECLGVDIIQYATGYNIQGSSEPPLGRSEYFQLHTTRHTTPCKAPTLNLLTENHACESVPLASVGPNSRLNSELLPRLIYSASFRWQQRWQPFFHPVCLHNHSSARSGSPLSTPCRPAVLRPCHPPANLIRSRIIWPSESISPRYVMCSKAELQILQMASTAAGVAVGHTMGQGLSSMLFGGGSKEEAPVAAPQSKAFDEPRMGGQCETSAKDFTRCLESTNNDMNSCRFFLEQLKACQEMFPPTR
ncbi:uncharacterized protein VP01_1283g3 [Puccinia sorghi]|uniref:CHCH domain-containing protein n=1 Tax=Puccinia sorghi TaxID=27349 RepID=A0A0L6VNN1_9BASI|nr:uncharacterized protein VP01_1283g3 [Puccinia sorghi]